MHALVTRHLRCPGQRWKARGWVFKDAGWRAASVVGMWARGMKEELVVLSDLPAEWAVLGYYERRFWIEPGFRNDKSRGWEWEASQ
ncbi:MAG: transposase, partial [Actinomycetota bacterium]|nr:transposase [Actinomycetota bacterium]